MLWERNRRPQRTDASPAGRDENQQLPGVALLRRVLFACLNTFLACFPASLASFVLGLWVLLRRRERPVGLARVFAVGLAVAGATALAAGGAILGAGKFFLAVNLVYCGVALVAPLLALVLLVASRRRATTLAARIAGATVLLVVAPLGVHATFVAPYQLVTERTRIALPARAGFARPLRIALLSDLQTVEITDHEREAVRRVMEARPDLILLPGDLVQVGTHRIPEIRPALQELLALLDAPLGVFFVHGDCETVADAHALLDGTRVRILVNETVALEHEGQRLLLCGVENGYGSSRSRAAIEDFDANPDGGALRLLLAHRPDVATTLEPRSRVDLLVCGHTHGGQVQLPWIGPPVILSNVPREVGAGGLHLLGGHRLYVSRGIGWEHGHAPRVRFRCPPEVSLLELVPEGRSGPDGGAAWETERLRSSGAAR